jgi:hypothetical protein
MFERETFMASLLQCWTMNKASHLFSACHPMDKDWRPWQLESLSFDARQHTSFAHGIRTRSLCQTQITRCGAAVCNSIQRPATNSSALRISYSRQFAFSLTAYARAVSIPHVWSSLWWHDRGQASEIMHASGGSSHRFVSGNVAIPAW